MRPHKTKNHRYAARCRHYSLTSCKMSMNTLCDSGLMGPRVAGTSQFLAGAKFNSTIYAWLCNSYFIMHFTKFVHNLYVLKRNSLLN